MTRESPRKKFKSGQSPCSWGDVAPTLGPERKELTPERARELQARQRAIGLELRRMFDDVTKEPVPKEFLELLQQIDRKRED